MGSSPCLGLGGRGEGTERRQTEVQHEGWKRSPAFTSGKLGRGGNVGSELRRVGEISVMKTRQGKGAQHSDLKKRDRSGRCSVATF